MLAAVLFAQRLERLVDFYQCFGFSIADSAAAGHTLLVRGADRAGGADELMLVQIPAAVAADIEIETPARRRSDGAVKLVFEVDSIDSALARAQTLGGRTDPDDRRWNYRGHDIQDAIDPEGNVYQLRQVSDAAAAEH